MIEQIEYGLWAGNLLASTPAERVPLVPPTDTGDEDEPEEVRDPTDPPPARTGK
jgi:hypothetical protein